MQSNPSKPENIRRASNSEIDAVCAILASAFSDDPVMAWMNGHPEIYASMFYAEAKPLYFKRGLVYVNESMRGAALWAPPEVNPEAPMHWSTLKMLWQMFRTGGKQSLRRGTLLEKILQQHHIKEPHYYLFAIGAAQGNQGQGIGSALLEAGLAECDKNPHPVYLESSNIKNNILYQRFGFEVLEEVELPENGPKMWPMLRPKRNVA